VVTGSVRRTVLLGKYDIFEAAQYGTQRFSAKRVIPTALVVFHVDQWVAVSPAFASAQVMTKLAGLNTFVFVHVSNLTGDVAAEVEDPAAPAGTATSGPTRARVATNAAIRKRGWNMG
jgi:hypothetical protein